MHKEVEVKFDEDAYKGYEELQELVAKGKSSKKKPTTCGKLERFWGTHNIERWNFPSLRKFLDYYNHRRPHMSLDYLTPYEVYVRDMKV